MEIKKTTNGFGYKQYEFIKDNKIFKISFMGNGDLYWSLTNLNINDSTDYDVFTISIDDNYDIYCILQKLYLDIKNAKIYDTFDEVSLFNIYNEDEELDDFEKKINAKDKQKIKAQKLKERDAYNLLFNNEKISWISDDSDYDTDSILQISQKDNTFILEFVRKDKEDKDKFHYLSSYSNCSISIRFRNSGSRYDPFNIIFMNMYNDLANYNFKMQENEEIEGQLSIFEYKPSILKK